MSDLQESVERKIKDFPLFEYYWDEGLLNLSAFARVMKSELEQELGKKMSHPAMVMGLSRLDLRRTHPGLFVDAAKFVKNIKLVRNLFEITYSNTPETSLKIKELLEVSHKQQNLYINVTRGAFETTLIVSQELKPQIYSIFEDENMIIEFNDIASITLELQETNTQVPGIYYAFLQELTKEGISLTEAHSTFREFSIFLRQKYAEKAFNILQGYVKL